MSRSFSIQWTHKLLCFALAACSTNRSPQALRPCPVQQLLAARAQNLGPDDPWVLNMLHQVEFPLPSEAIWRIERHALFGLGAQNKRGQGMRFVLAREFGNHSYFRGEQIQTAFVSKVIKKAFPLATVDVTRPGVRPASGDVLLSVLDPAEFSLADRSAVLEMPILKLANPNSVALRSLSQLRGQYGISETDRLLSLTMHSAAYPDQIGRKINFPAFLKTLQSAKTKADVIIVSAGYDDISAVRASLRGSEFQDIDWIPLSRLTQNAYKQIRASGQTVYVFNDTRGILPYLYRISDVALIVGAINAAEPLNTGTRTLHYLGNTVSPGYDKATLATLISRYKQSQGYHMIQSLPGLKDSLDKVEALPAPKALPFLDSRTADGPFEIALDHIYSRVSLAIQAAKTQP